MGLWQKQENKLKDNEIEIGTKHPVYYGLSIAAVLKKFGECRVYVNLNKDFWFKGEKKSIVNQWDDVSKNFLDMFETIKVIKDDTTKEYRVLLLTW